MKNQWTILAAALACLPVPPSSGGSGTFRFERMQAIEGSFAPGVRGRIAATGDLFGEARSFPDDLRIVGADGTEWPFFLYVETERPDAAIVHPIILNQTWVGGDDPYLCFELSIPRVDGQAPVHNALELCTTGDRFIRRVEILAATGTGPVGRMGEGYLIEIQQPGPARNRTVRYPPSDAARLEVRIHANAEASSERFELLSATLRHRSERPVGREPVAFAEMAVPKSEQEEGTDTRILDTGWAGRPVEFVSFDVSTPSYVRCVRVLGRNAEHEPWRRVGGGAIHALPGDDATTVRVRAACRYLKVRLVHHDDPPLALDAIRLDAIPRWLVFESASEGSARIYFRAWDVAAPRYDLQERMGGGDPLALPQYQTRPSEPNADARIQPWRKYSKVLGGVAVGGVSLVVLGVIVRMLRQQAGGEPLP